METQSVTGILQNQQGRIDACAPIARDAIPINGNQYTGGQAAGCCIPNGVVFDKQFNKRDIEGYYAIRVFFDTDTVLDPYTHLLTLEIYEDGVLKIWDTGDSSDGQIILDYVDQTRTLGSRIVLWFDPNITYRILLRTTENVSGFTVNVDYIQLTQIHHANPLMSWVNASELVGGDLWMMDEVRDTVTGTGAATVKKVVGLNYKFKEIYYVGVTFENTVMYNAALDNSAYSGINPENTNEVPLIIGSAGGTNFSGALLFRCFVVGSVELPMVRPL
jgi:hypothetical protein